MREAVQIILRNVVGKRLYKKRPAKSSTWATGCNKTGETENCAKGKVSCEVHARKTATEMQ